MYSASSVAVDKGLGFDFSGIADLVKTGISTGLNIYQNQMQLKQVKQLAAQNTMYGYPAQSPSVYGQQYGILPMSQVMQPQPTFGSQQMVAPSRGMDTSTMLLLGVGLVGAVAAFKFLVK